jgi:hypothetical protein
MVSSGFVGVPQLRRQDDVWAVVDAALSPEQMLEITLILTFAPDEVQMVP